jgi:O-antigen/teichoic acid export membrane protein
MTTRRAPHDSPPPPGRAGRDAPESDTAGNEGPLARRTATSVAWMTLQTWLSRLGGFVTVAILARLLTPADFGLVAIASTVLPLVYLLADMGLTTYLVQADRLDARTTATAFWFSAAAGLVLSAALVLLAPAIAALFGTAAAAPVIAWTAPAVLIVSLSATPVALLRRGMRFRALSMQTAVAAIIGQILALVLAFGGAGVWALVAQLLAMQLVCLVLAWASARWRPSFAISAADIRRMFGFGSKVVTVDLLAIGRLWIENAVITRMLGVAALGAYGVAQRLVQTARDLTGSAITPVTTVAFAKVRDEPERLLGGYRRAVGLAYGVVAPGLAVLFVGAPLVVPLLLGPQWQASIEPVRALALAGLFALGASLDHGLLYGMGRPGAWLGYAAVVEVATLAATLLLVPRGIAAIAWGFAAVAAAALCGRWFLTGRVLRTGWWRIATLWLPQILAFALMSGVGFAVLLSTVQLPPLVALALVALAVTGAHAAGLRLLMPPTSRELWGFVVDRARRGRRSSPTASGTRGGEG